MTHAGPGPKGRNLIGRSHVRETNSDTSYFDKDLHALFIYLEPSDARGRVGRRGNRVCRLHEK
jgi:hypothetical protein